MSIASMLVNNKIENNKSNENMLLNIKGYMFSIERKRRTKRGWHSRLIINQISKV